MNLLLQITLTTTVGVCEAGLATHTRVCITGEKVPEASFLYWCDAGQ
jgi:hypothetical protein